MISKIKFGGSIWVGKSKARQLKDPCVVSLRVLGSREMQRHIWWTREEKTSSSEQTSLRTGAENKRGFWRIQLANKMQGNLSKFWKQSEFQVFLETSNLSSRIKPNLKEKWYVKYPGQKEQKIQIKVREEADKADIRK